MIYKPKEYAELVLDGAFTSATVRNWIKHNKLPANARAEQTLTGHYLIHVDDDVKSDADKLIDMIDNAA